MRAIKESCVTALSLLIGTACIFTGCSWSSAKAKEATKVPEVQEKEDALRRESGELYIYQQLTEDEKNCYDIIYTGFMNKDKDIDLSDYSNQTIQDIYEAIHAEHSEIFWVRGYELSTIDGPDGYTAKYMNPNYIRRVNDIAIAKTDIDKAVDPILESVANMNSYDKSKYLYQWICDHTVYQSGTNDQDIRSVFIEGRSVCQGYASAYQYLLSKSGIKSFVLRGIHDGELHAWVAAKIGDSWYYSDPTLGDAGFRSPSGMRNFIDYSYFNMTEDECAKTHYSLSNVVLPNGNSDWNSYFIKERLYFNVYDEEKVCKRIQEEYKSQDYIILKFGSKDERKKAADSLFTDAVLANYITDTDVIYLSSGEKLIIFR